MVLCAYNVYTVYENNYISSCLVYNFVDLLAQLKNFTTTDVLNVATCCKCILLKLVMLNV